tara:strand:+ start:84 stop:404 length:321 start_codon:yes stop_codon:yes gene_type:complete
VLVELIKNLERWLLDLVPVSIPKANQRYPSEMAPVRKIKDKARWLLESMPVKLVRGLVPGKEPSQWPSEIKPEKLINKQARWLLVSMPVIPPKEQTRLLLGGKPVN